MKTKAFNQYDHGRLIGLHDASDIVHKMFKEVQAIPDTQIPASERLGKLAIMHEISIKLRNARLKIEGK